MDGWTTKKVSLYVTTSRRCVVVVVVSEKIDPSTTYLRVTKMAAGPFIRLIAQLAIPLARAFAVAYQQALSSRSPPKKSKFY